MFNYRYLVPKKVKHVKSRALAVSTKPNHRHRHRKGPESLHNGPDHRTGPVAQTEELFYIHWVLQTKVFMIYTILFFRFSSYNETN